MEILIPTVMFGYLGLVLGMIFGLVGVLARMVEENSWGQEAQEDGVFVRPVIAQEVWETYEETAEEARRGLYEIGTVAQAEAAGDIDQDILAERLQLVLELAELAPHFEVAYSALQILSLEELEDLWEEVVVVPLRAAA